VDASMTEVLRQVNQLDIHIQRLIQLFHLRAVDTLQNLQVFRGFCKNPLLPRNTLVGMAQKCTAMAKGFDKTALEEIEKEVLSLCKNVGDMETDLKTELQNVPGVSFKGQAKAVAVGATVGALTMGGLVASECCGVAGTLAIGGSSTIGIGLAVLAAAVVIGGLAFLLMKAIETLNRRAVRKALESALDHCEKTKEKLDLLEKEVVAANTNIKTGAQVLEATGAAAQIFEDLPDKEFHLAVALKIETAHGRMELIVQALTPKNKGTPGPSLGPSPTQIALVTAVVGTGIALTHVAAQQYVPVSG